MGWHGSQRLLLASNVSRTVHAGVRMIGPFNAGRVPFSEVFGKLHQRFSALGIVEESTDG